MSVSWEDVERMLASGSPQDTLSHLQALDKILNATPKAPAPVVTVAGVDDDVFHFDYTREMPCDDYHIENSQPEKEIGDSARILTMRSPCYADMMECFSPIFADPACLNDTISLSSKQPPSSPANSAQPLLSTPSSLLASLKGRAKEEVVPLLLSSDLSTEAKVDIALQYFSTCK